MNQTFLEKNKARLEAEKKRLEELLGRVANRQTEVKSEEEYAAKFPNLGDDMDDNATEVSMYEANLGEEKSLESRLLKVNAALERIAAGTYGMCAVGGEPIDEARLAAVPEADICIAHSR